MWGFARATIIFIIVVAIIFIHSIWSFIQKYCGALSKATTFKFSFSVYTHAKGDLDYFKKTMNIQGEVLAYLSAKDRELIRTFKEKVGKVIDDIKNGKSSYPKNVCKNSIQGEIEYRLSQITELGNIDLSVVIYS